MNLVDLIASQMTGDVVGKLGGLIGASESDTRTATNAAIPALLKAFSGLASTPKGADQLASAMGGLDLSQLGNLAGLLGGGQAQGLGNLGGNLLGSLLGSNATAKMVDAIAAFAGIKPGILRSLLTYLVPIVLGMIAKQMGGKPTGAGLSRLFSEQAGNISSAVPRGLSLADVGRAAEPANGGMPGWLPLAALVALAAGAWWWINRDRMNVPAGREIVEDVVDTVKKVGPVTVVERDVVATDGKDVVEALAGAIAIDPKFLEAGKTAGTLLNGLTKVLSGVKDEASAKAALPELEKLAPVLTTLQDETAKLPGDERPAFAKVIAENLGPLQKLIDTVMAIPGVKQLLGPVLTPMVEALAKLGA